MNGYDPMIKFQNSKRVSDLENADGVFDAIRVPREFDDHIRVFDEVDDLVLIHYLTLVPEVSHVRGIIVRLGDQPVVVAGTFPHTPEGSWDEVASDLQPSDIKYATIAYEGTILRLFFSGTKWYLSTHKKIDGTRSRWSGATFGSSWLEVFGTDSPSTYFPEMVGTCYAFLLSDPSNRMVCHIPEKKLYHVGTFTGLTLSPANSSDYTAPHANITINTPLTHTDNLREVVAELAWQVATGVLVWTATNFIKLVPEQYIEMKNIRGNEPNMRMRYLQLLLTGESHLLRTLFPEKAVYFDEIDCQYNSLIPYLYDLFSYRYEEGQYLRLDKEEHYILNNVSNAVLQGSVFTPQELITVALTRSNARQLNAMIKRSLKLEV